MAVEMDSSNKRGIICCDAISDELHVSEKKQKLDNSDAQSLIQDAQQIAIILNIEEDTALEKLRLRETSPNRVQLTINDIMESREEQERCQSVECRSHDIDVVVQRLKDVDPTILAEENTISHLLKIHSKEDDSVEFIVKLLVENDSMPVEENVYNGEKDLVDILREETVSISKLFPAKDQNEIYAYLEHYHDEKNRLTLVIEEMLGARNTDSQGTENTPSTLELSQGFDDMASPQRQDTLEIEQDKKQDQFLEDIDVISAIFPDCEPNYIAERLYAMSSLSDRVAKLTSEMIESKDYPKLKEHRERMRYMEMKNQWLAMSFRPEEFLKMCTNPLTYYYDVDKSVFQPYIDHCLTHLHNNYTMLHSTYIDKIFEENKKHLSPTVSVLANDAYDYEQGICYSDPYYNLV